MTALGRFVAGLIIVAILILLWAFIGSIGYDFR